MWSRLSLHVEFQGNRQGGSRGRADMRIGEHILTAQIIGFICILNENFWPVGLDRVEFVGNQKIPGKGKGKENK